VVYAIHDPWPAPWPLICLGSALYRPTRAALRCRLCHRLFGFCSKRKSKRAKGGGGVFLNAQHGKRKEPQFEFLTAALMRSYWSGRATRSRLATAFYDDCTALAGAPRVARIGTKSRPRTLFATCASKLAPLSSRHSTATTDVPSV
jgi:hypothetical protein